MKATGIVRRIDDLGRVVIPKEIRKTLRIREGDPLEIFTDKEGEVILKKYSPICELNDFALQYAESLHKSSGHITCISDRDMIIAVCGAPKKDYLEKSLSKDLERIIQDKSDVLVSSSKEKSIAIVEDDESHKSIRRRSNGSSYIFVNRTKCKNGRTRNEISKFCIKFFRKAVRVKEKINIPYIVQM